MLRRVRFNVGTRTLGGPVNQEGDSVDEQRPAANRSGRHPALADIDAAGGRDRGTRGEFVRGENGDRGELRFEQTAKVAPHVA